MPVKYPSGSYVSFTESTRSIPVDSLNSSAYPLGRFNLTASSAASCAVNRYDNTFVNSVLSSETSGTIVDGSLLSSPIIGT